MSLKAALPNYMVEHLKNQDIPPGHRFGLYFEVWQDDWKKADEKTDDRKKIKALEKATRLSDTCCKMAKALRQRQQIIALQNDALAYFPAISTSPFMTGIGSEHPLENGFAFLNPYGLPYLPGSSIKGVLRTAAEELALGLYGETEGWDMLAVWWLFGFEAGSAMLSNKTYKINVLDEEAKRRRQAYQDWVTKGDYEPDSLERIIKSTVEKKDQTKYVEQPQQFLTDLVEKQTLRKTLANQGALSFWDVYPQSKTLAMDILTPHHGGYFQGKNAPHDSEQPNPNVFLTVPPGSQFDFYSTCEIERLPNALQQSWQQLLQSAFKYAFDWLGFGAKTAVGYGQMQMDQSQLNQISHEKKRQVKQKAEQQRLASLSPFHKDLEEFLQKIQPQEHDTRLLKELENGRWEADEAKQVAEKIKQLMEQAGKWMPDFPGTNKQKVKLKERSLKVLKFLD